METYLLVGLIFYLLAVLANDSILAGWKTQRGQTIFAAVVFVIFWFPILAVLTYTLIKKNWETK